MFWGCVSTNVSVHPKQLVGTVSWNLMQEGDFAKLWLMSSMRSQMN